MARLSTAMAKKTLSRVSVVAEVKEKCKMKGQSEGSVEKK